jgi:hypothetical protein
VLSALLGAAAAGRSGLAATLVEGWNRARTDKQYRLTMAWLREQLRLSLEDIVAEGVARRTFRPGLDSGAVAAIALGAAESCLLQAESDGGAVPPERLVRAFLRLTVTEGPEG